MTNNEANLTIDYLKEMQEEYIEGEGYERHPLPEWYALDKALEVIEQTIWIPVSERLPEAFRFVNCTCHSLIDDREDWVVETCYLPQLPDSPYSDWGNIPMLNNGDCEVVAWMYRNIPEPYKGE